MPEDFRFLQITVNRPRIFTQKNSPGHPSSSLLSKDLDHGRAVNQSTQSHWHREGVCVCAIFSYKIVIQFYAPKSRAMWLRDFESLRIIFFLEESRQHLPVLEQRASNSERVLVGSRLWNWRESLSKTGRAFPTNVVFLNMFDQWNNLYRLGDCVTHLSDPRSTGFRHPFQREGFPP